MGMSHSVEHSVEQPLETNQEPIEEPIEEVEPNDELEVEPLDWFLKWV